MALTPEGKLKAQVKKLLDESGFWRAGSWMPKNDVRGWYYMPVQNGMGTVGIPDFVGCDCGKFFCIETKAPGGKLTANQEQRIKEIKAAGGIALVVNDIKQLEEYLNE